MNATAAHITGTSIIITRTEETGRKVTVATEVRPASFDSADEFLAFHSMGRTAPWELSDSGMVSAPVAPIDNRFNGTVAAFLWDAVGTTHEPFETVLATSVQNGDIITDSELSELYVVAGSRPEDGGMKIHMVAGRKTWADRYTTVFHGLVTVARRKA